MTQGLAIVTGGTRGIGAAISIKLRDSGYKVIANYHSNDECAKKFRINNEIDVHKWDVSDYDQCRVNIEKIEQQHGSFIKILINNAGITRDTMFHKMSKEAWDDVIKCNLYSCYNMCTFIYPKMRLNGFGRIVNIASINGISGQIGQVNYAASKAAIIGFSKSLAKEGASRNVTVNVVAPGYISTDLLDSIEDVILQQIINSIPMGRLGKPEEVADLVAFLASQKSAFITGGTFSINGGQYMQ